MQDQPPWRAFEHEVGLLVSAFGYVVEVTPASNDFGADVIAVKRGRRVAIQCKFYASGRIGHPVKISLSGAKAFTRLTKPYASPRAHLLSKLVRLLINYQFIW